MAEESQILADAAKLPIDERCAHANWKVRSAAYEQIKASCNSVFDQSDPVLNEYVGVFPKACADGNAAALDKALEALQAFLEKASDSLASRIAGSASSNIVGKALGARSSTMAKGIDCLMGFVEVDQAEKITNPLLEGCKHKVPKVVLGSLEALLQLVRAFGGRVMPAQQILKTIGPMFESKDAKAREITKNIVAELARWMGPELIRANLYDKLRDAQKDDVEKLLQEAPAGRPKPERLTRKDAEKAAVAVAPAAADEDSPVAAAGAAAAAVVEDEPEQIDSYEFAEPKDIIPELKKDFWDGLASAKWSERKAALTALKELAAYPRLANGDYADVNRELKKIITKDSNINVVAEAINCTANIAKGLRKDYRGPAMSLCPVLLEKFKDKAGVVTRAAAEALDMMHLYSFALPDVAEDVSAALAHQNPKVKESTGIWLASCTSRETKANVLKLLSGVIPAAVKCTDEGAPAIREAAFSFLVQAALKAGSLGALDKALSKMDDGKRKKLEEMVLEAAKARRPGAAAAAAGGIPAAAQVPVRASSNRSIRAPASGGPSPVTSPRASNSGQAARPAAGRSSSVRSSSSRPPAGAKPKSAAAANGTAAGGSAAADGAVEDESALSGGLLNAHEAKARLAELFGEELTTALGDAQWKARLEGMETVVAKAQEPDAAGYAAVLVQCMAHVPGFDDKNFQVMAKEFEVIRCCAAHSTFSKREVLVAVMGATDKLADLKLKEPAFQMLLAASEAVGPQLVASLLHKRAAAHKNPKVLTETINWMNLAVQEFLLPAFNVKLLLDWAKEDLGSANAATRTAATQFLGSLHAFVGPQLAEMVRADLKPATMATVEAEFAKNPQQSGWQAKRVCRIAPTTKAAGGGSKPKGKGAAAAAAAEEPPSMDDLLPRADISGQITGELVAMLGSANWKERKAALDEVEGIIAAAGGRIQPCVGDLMLALKGRLADSNKNLIAQTLMLLAKLAKAMGRAIAREARPVLGPSVRCICDSKANVRAAVIEMLDAWVSVAPADSPFEELTDILPSPKCVSEGMQAGISWMASVYSAGRGTSSDSIAHAVKAMAIGAGYKTIPVRDAAGQLLEAMLGTVGLGEVQRAVQCLDKTLQKVAAEALTKAGISAAAAAAAPVAASSRPGTASGNRATVGGSRPGTAGSRVGSAPASRPETAGSGVSRSVAASSVGSLRSSTAAGLAAVAAAVDEGPLLCMDKNKEDRARKARFKSSKFEIRPDEVQALEAELGALAAPGLRANLVAKDFKKQIQAADAIKNWLMDQQPEVLDICISCLDLLLRWSVVRLAEGNTQTLVGVTGMLKVLFELLAEQGYRLSEAEIKVFLPGLVEKCGQPTPQMREACRDLIRRVATMHPPSKVVTFLQEGLLSKNNRSRVTCAEEIAYLVDKEGPKVYGGAKSEVLQALAKLTSEQGKEIRAAALGALEVVYAFEGEGIWKRLGNLNGQQQGIIEERLKTMGKDLAKKGLSAGYKKAEYEAARSSQALDTSYSDTAAALQAPAVAPATFSGGRSILDSVQPNAYPAAGGYGAAANGVAPQFGSQAVLPGLSNSAGLISLRNSSGTGAAESSAFSRSTSLLATAEYHAAGQPQLLMSSVPAATAHAVDQQAVQPGAQPQQQQPAAAAQRADLNLQPLQSFIDPTDLQVEFDKCLGVLQCGHVDDVVEVMKLLCYEMMDLQRHQAVAATGNPSANPQAEMVWRLLLKQVDPLVVLLTMQTQQVFVAASMAMRTGQLSAADCRACKYALNTLMNIFSSNALPVGLRLETLAGLVRVLLLRLVDDNLGRMAEGEALLKALNVLMLKILENSNRNFTFSALLSLLLDIPTDMAATGAEAAQQQALAMRWADLVVKCLIKSTKALPQVINTIDLRSLLLSIHGFFEALGVDEIRRRSHADDKPLRMVKTILHELCKLKGTDIYRYTADIPQQGSTSGADGKPVIFPYIDLNIQTLQGNGVIRTAGVQNPITPGRQAAGVGAGTAAATRGGAMTPGAALRSQKDSIVGRLSDVFGRLSNLMQTSTKDSSEKRAVLMDIYTISQEQGMPIDKLMAMYLPDTTPAFKSWITGELNKINEELQQSGQQGLAAAADYQRDIPVLDVSVGTGAAGNGGYAAPYRAGDSVVTADGPGSAGKLAASAAGGLSNTMEALKARMTQLQVEKSRIRPAAAAVDSSPGTAAAGGGVFVRAVPAPTPAPAAAAEAVPAAVVAAPQPAAAPAGGSRNLQDLRSRMRGLLS